MVQWVDLLVVCLKRFGFLNFGVPHLLQKHHLPLSFCTAPQDIWTRETDTNMTSVLPPVLSVIWSIFSAPVILSLLFESMNCGKLACKHSSVQFSSVAQSCPTLCDPMNCSMPDLPVHHQPPELIKCKESYK